MSSRRSQQRRIKDYVDAGFHVNTGSKPRSMERQTPVQTDELYMETQLRTAECFSIPSDDRLNVELSDYSDGLKSSSSIDFSSSCESEDEASAIASDLRDWSIEGNVSHALLTSLLLRLRRYFPSLPKSARTLLATPATTTTSTVSGMECMNFSLHDQLLREIKRNSCLRCLNTISVSVNIDGMSPFKSSATVLWPVLASIDNLDHPVVFPLSLTCGGCKPTNLQFLDHFVEEFNNISSSGILMDGKRYEVELAFIVCDAPAKAFVKGTKLCSGYFGCDRCDQKGERFVDDKGNGRIIYPNTDALNIRTDDSFRRRHQMEHHITNSPLEGLQINMVTHFPVDFMHQICLGVMRKLLLLWVKGTRNDRLSQQQIMQMNGSLSAVASNIPRCFSRKPRSLTQLERWKATEFRLFLLYLGPIILKPYLPEKRYLHFLHLNIAISIMADESLLDKYIDYAHACLLYFVKMIPTLYSSQLLVYNVHSLLHVADDVRRYGPLERFSAFRFENHMRHLKNKLRSGHRILAQLGRRLSEMENDSFVDRKHSISCKSPDNAYILNDNYCALIEDIIGNTCLTRYYHCDSLFNNPCNSSILSFYKCSVNGFVKRNIPIQSVTKQAMCFKDGNTLYFLKLRHC